ncbi:MAG: type II toxin-antitoxin system VapC family toxin, partial [Bifidobacteriaceae bacterium]|nr:type II toxin-antitoxin system VapC family toxin [Bifidobacteriaceae bacterium]
MRAVLDTNVLIWAARESAKLSAPARSFMRDRANQLVVPPSVSWELAIKHRKGKLPEAAALLADYSGLLARFGAATLPITDAHTLLAGRLEWAHEDPFDRLVAAVAIVEGLPLISG